MIPVRRLGINARAASHHANRTVIPLMRNQSATRSLELKLPPVALGIMIALAMWVARGYAPALNFEFPLQSFLASIFALIGLIAAAAGVREFRQSKTTVNPTIPTSSSSLVTHGVYRYTRNPMYLGFLLLLLGCAIATSNIIAFLLLPAFVLYLNRFQIEPEERALTKIFGAEFEAYCAVVRRWI